MTLDLCADENEPFISLRRAVKDFLYTILLFKLCTSLILSNVFFVIDLYKTSLIMLMADVMCAQYMLPPIGL